MYHKRKRTWFVIVPLILLILIACIKLLGMNGDIHYDEMILYKDNVKINKEVRAIWQQQGTGFYLMCDEENVEDYIPLEILSPYTENYCKGGDKSIEIDRIIDFINEKYSKKSKLVRYKTIYAKESDSSGFELIFSDDSKVIWYYVEDEVVSRLIENQSLLDVSP